MYVYVCVCVCVYVCVCVCVYIYTVYMGVEGAVRGLEGIHLADRCILTRLE